MVANQVASRGLMPDLSIVVDVPVALAAERRAGTRADRIEAAGTQFMNRVRDGFLFLARERYPQQTVVVDGIQSPDAVASDVTAAVTLRLHPQAKLGLG